MKHELIWRVSDREKLERRMELAFRDCTQAEGTAKQCVQMFIWHITSCPAGSLPGEAPVEEEWRWGVVRIKFRRYPADRLVEVSEICND